VEVVAEPRDETICMLCTAAVGLIEDLLKKNTTEEAIIKQLEAVCKLAPQSYQTICKSILEEYGPMLIAGFVDTEDPNTLCHHVGLCK